MADESLRILVVDQDLSRAAVLEAGLREAGHSDVLVVHDMQNLMRRIVDAEPDVVFIDLGNPNRDVLEAMFQVSRSVRRPVAMFVDRSDAHAIEAAVEAGVSAYVVDGLRKERVKPVLDLCVSRFKAYSRLQDDLEQARRALDERKLVDRAKGLLMSERGMTEAEAYAALRSAAMDGHMKIAEVAQSLLTASRLLRPKAGKDADGS